jgi:hypothetical protein
LAVYITTDGDGASNRLDVRLLLEEPRREIKVRKGRVEGWISSAEGETTKRATYHQDLSRLGRQIKNQRGVEVVSMYGG